MSASALIRAAPAASARPWPRHMLSPEGWRSMADALADEPGLALLALWADTGHVHALFQDETPLLASAPVEAGLYAALSPHRPAAAWFERMVHDLWGHAAAGGLDLRPWLDHGRWPVLRPLSHRAVPHSSPPEAFEFLPAEGEDLHAMPLGPVHAGIAECSHLSVTASGETVVRLEVLLGYAHKGTLALMRGKPVRAAAQLAARLSGDSAVAHGVAFARAAEAAFDLDVPPRAHALRGVMAELERIANHLGDLGAVCGEAGFAFADTRFGLHREAMLRAAGAAFGHRLMMDLVVPGGTAADISSTGAHAIVHALDALAAELPSLVQTLDATAGFAARLVGAGVIPPGLAAALAPGGFAGRASGQARDARRSPGYPPYDALAFTVPVLASGDVDARMRVRLAEIGASAGLLRALLAGLPPGPHEVVPPSGSGEGLGVAEGFRGDVWHWLRLDHGSVATAFSADPSWRQWPLVEAAAQGGPVADVPLILRSINPSCSGVDL